MGGGGEPDGFPDLRSGKAGGAESSAFWAACENPPNDSVTP